MTDTMIMVRRTVKHTFRNPGALVMSILMPVLLLLLFVGVFGGAIGAGVRGDYVNYLLAGVLLTTVGYGATITAMAVNRDLTSGVINRLRTMAISRTSVLSGHVIGSTARTLVSTALVVGTAVLLGFRSTGGLGRWLATAGLVLLLTLALTWLAVAVGLAAKTAEGTAPYAMVVQLLPFLSSAFVPTDSMSAPVRWFAAHEPFTPITDALRALVLGTPLGSDGVVAVAWCVGLTGVGFLWARTLFSRDPR